MYASPLLLLICDVIWGKIKTHTHGELVSIMPVKGGGGKKGGGERGMFYSQAFSR